MMMEKNDATTMHDDEGSEMLAMTNIGASFFSTTVTIYSLRFSVSYLNDDFSDSTCLPCHQDSLNDNSSRLICRFFILFPCN